jgi:hypothetical protein
MASQAPSSSPAESTRVVALGWRRATVRALLAVANTLLIVLIVNWLLWRRYVHRAKEHRSLPNLDEPTARMGFPKTLLRSIGIPPQDDRAGLATTSRTHPGTIRVGALGDSFTFGTEVIAGYDYPSRLREIFARMGLENVDVLNFGIQWIGLGQTYRVWDAFARDYDLDFVLLGPETLYSEREETFNHAITSMSDYIHGRYVLRADGGLDFIDAEGDADRFERYFTFFPSHDYLRFDRRAPSFLEAWLPWGRELANPFYYSALSPQKESQELYLRLLRRFASEAKETVLIQGDPGRAALAAGVAGRIEWASVGEPNRFPYTRPRGHLSEAGNERVAEAYADILLGHPSIGLEEIAVSDASDIGQEEGRASEPLSTFERVRVSIGSQTIGAYIHQGTWAPEDDLVDPQREGIRSLLSLATPGTSFLDALAAPLDFDIERGTKVDLDLGGEGRSDLHVLGDVVLPNAQVQVGYCLVRGVETHWQVEGADETSLCFDATSLGLPPLVHGVVRVGSHPAFEVVSGDAKDCPLRLRPLGRPWVSVRPLAGRRLETDRLAQHGDVALEVPTRQESLPIGSYRKQTTRIDYRSSGPRQVIRKDGSVGRLEVEP